jgi:hypothetical protein
MKLIHLGLCLALAAPHPATIFAASAADIGTSRSAQRASLHQQHRLPLALRTLSRRSASVYASTPCWRGCTAQCGWLFQGCLRHDELVLCQADNNQCELSCLKQCRPLGGPLVSWTDY